jgi:CheY-like chemotaxis protein
MPFMPARRVLVVDDNVDTANSIAMLLRAEGHDVHVAHDGLKALEIARSVRPEFVFLDLGLPGLDGFEVARALRREPDLQGVRIIAITGYGQESDRRKAVECGIDQHLLKPADPAFLESLLGSRREP